MGQAVVDVVVDKGLLGGRNRLLDGVKLLGEINAGPLILHHLDHGPNVTFRAFEALDDVGMRCMRDVYHAFDLSPGRDRSNDERPLEVHEIVALERPMMFSPLKNAAYRHLFIAQVAALLGTGMATVALGLLAHDLAGAGAGEVLASPWRSR